MTREIDDPDFGPVELPEEFVDPETFDARIEEARGVYEDRLWPEGESFECPQCGEETFNGCSDLTYRTKRGRHVISFRHLHGASCTNCGAKTLEPYEQIGVEDKMGVGSDPDYEASVSSLESGSLGIEWPMEVQRFLGLDPTKRAFIEIIDSDAVLVRFEDEDEA